MQIERHALASTGYVLHPEELDWHWITPVKETKEHVLTWTCINCHDSHHHILSAEKSSTPSTDSWMTKCAKEAVARFSYNSSCRFQINHHCNRTSKILRSYGMPLHPLLNFLPSQKHKLDISQWPQWLGDLWQWWNMMKSSFIMNFNEWPINIHQLLYSHLLTWVESFLPYAVARMFQAPITIQKHSSTSILDVNCQSEHFSKVTRI